MGLLKNHLPCKCTNHACGLEFQAGNLVSGPVTMTGCSTTCPRCGSSAKILDGKMSQSGQYVIRDVFNLIGGIKENTLLESIKADLEASNDAITANELADSLVEIDPSFSKFAEVIRSIPSSSVVAFIGVIINIITLVLLYQTLVTNDEHHEEDISLQKEQIQLEREKFEYEKRKDKKEDESRSKSTSEAKNIQKQIEKLKLDFEEKFKALEKNNTTIKKSSKHIKKLKGSLRNKPCLCGSGIKGKKCHPNGYNV